MAENPPYLLSPGTLARALEKIRQAATPERFTGDFVATVVGIKGGSGRALIPFFKRAGFVKSDGSPTELYNQFRNPAQTRKAAAIAFRNAFKSLYERNEFIHAANDTDLKGAIVELTGDSPDSRVVQAIFGTFKALKAFCDFEGKIESEEPEQKDEELEEDPKGEKPVKVRSHAGHGLNLSYTINLNLPATDDIKVFDAIFRSLKENLLKG